MDLVYKIVPASDTMAAQESLNESSAQGFVLDRIYIQGENIRFVMSKGFQSSPQMAREEIWTYAERQKTNHELPNENTHEFNRGYVKAMNDLINHIRKLLH